MNSMRILLCVGLTAFLASQTAGCRRRGKPEPAAASPTEVQPPPASTDPAASAPSPPASLPTGAGTALAPSTTGEPAQEAVKTQDRFNRNTLWMTKLGQNDPQLRAQVLAEIQRAGLSPAEMQELRRQAHIYGIRF